MIWRPKLAKPRRELFNLKSRKGQKLFFQNTNNNSLLVKCLLQRNIKLGGKKWLKCLKNIIHSSFKKIRLKENNQCKEEIKNILNSKDNHLISEFISNRNRNIIIEHLSALSSSENRLSTLSLWKIKQKVCPKVTQPEALAKIGNNGELVTNRAGLLKLYQSEYMKRLRHRDMKDKFFKLKMLKETLFNLRLQISKMRKSPDWSMNQLKKVLKSLKSNKSRDSEGLIFEIFKEDVAGKDLMESVLLLANKAKNEGEVPDFLKEAQITSIYKQKGSKKELRNERGIFLVSKVRSIIERLIYEDEYESVDETMSDSNVGGRKNRNVRDNLFVAYSIMNYARNNKVELDVTSYDLTQAFDSLWERETMNDLWEASVRDDKFALVYKMNETCKVRVKTPVGETEKFDLEEIEMQGTVLAPLKCSVQTDSIAKDCYTQKRGIFIYKECVFIPPLWMIDDCITFSICGQKSLIMNEIINTKIAMKKLQLSQDKCINMHCGKNEQKCPDLKVDEMTMKKSKEVKYVGDWLSSSMNNDANIERRAAKGIGSISSILSLLKQISLGIYHFEIALIFRDTILLSQMVFNSEVWINLKANQIAKLTTTDELYLLKIFALQRTVPKEVLYLETGKYPLVYILKQRRLMYYFHILKQPLNELISRVYHAMILRPESNDFCIQIEKDKKELNINLSDDEVQTF